MKIIAVLEQDAIDVLKAAGHLVENFAISETQKLVAEVKQTNLGTTALNIISALQNKAMSGNEKMEIVVTALVPALSTIASTGGISGLVVSIEDFALEMAQSVFNDFVANVLNKVAPAVEQAVAAA